MSVIIKPPFPRLRLGHPLAQGLTGAWFIGEGGGNKVCDASGRERHGTITGATWAGSDRGAALDFTGGSGNLVDIGTFAVLSEITLAAWVWWDAFSGARDDRIISKADGTGVANHDFMIGHQRSGTDRIRCRMGRDSGGITNLGTTALATGRWNFIAATFADSDRVSQLYLNGSPEGSATTHTAGAALPNNANAVYIGNQPTSTSSAPDGRIGSAFLWNRRLSADQIRELYLDPLVLIEPLRKTWMLGAFVGGGAAHTIDEEDSFSVGDAPALSFGKVLTESITLADAKALLAGLGKSDSIALADAKGLGIGKILADGFGLSDGQALAIGKILADSVSVGDARSLGIGKGLADSIELTDARALISLAKVLTESFGLSDSGAAVIAALLGAAFRRGAGATFQDELAGASFARERMEARFRMENAGAKWSPQA